MPEGLLPAKLFGHKPLAAFTNAGSLRTSEERMYWARPRAAIGVLGLLTLIAGGVIAKHAEVGLLTDGVQGIGIFLIIVGCMAFSMAVGMTWMEALLDGETPVYAMFMLVLTILWSVITGIILASSDEFARRLVGLLTVMTAVLLFFLVLWYVLIHVVAEHFDIPARHPNKDSDPGNVYHVLALAACESQHSAEDGCATEQPTLWELLSGRQFKAWAYGYKMGLSWSLVVLTAGAFLKAVDDDVVDLPEDAVQGVKAVGELLACFGAAGLLVSLAAGAAEFLPAEAIVEDMPFPERVRNRLACACISAPVSIFNSIWLAPRGADLLNNSEAVAMRCCGALLLTGAGCLALTAALHMALILFGARLTEELQRLRGDTTGDIYTAAATDKTIASVNTEELPPDKEMLPFPPRAIQGLSEELQSIGVGPYQAWQVLKVAPWRKWWRRRLLPAYLAGLLALLSGITAALRTELWDPAPSAWLELLVPLFGEVMAVGAAMCFLHAAATAINFLPIRVEAEAVWHFFNFVWCAARASHTFTFNKAGLRLAGMITMILALNELRCSLKAVLVAAAKLAIFNEEQVKLLGRQPYSVPILHLASLLVNGCRWSVQEFQREVRRDPMLRSWNRGMKTQFFGCLLLAFFGGVLKDDIMMPVLDLMLAKTMLVEDKHKDLHAHVLRPIGTVMAGIGATLLMQRLIAPFVECLLWMLELGLPHRLRCADIFAASFNAMWLVTYGVVTCGSDYRSERVVGILLVSLAVVRCSMCIGGGLLLIRTRRGQVAKAAERYMVDDSVEVAGAKDAQESGDARFEDSSHSYSAEEPLPHVNCSSPYRPSFGSTPPMSEEPCDLHVTPPVKPGKELDQGQHAQSGVPLAEDHQIQAATALPTTPTRPRKLEPVPQMAPSADGALPGLEPLIIDGAQNAETAGIMPTMLGQTGVFSGAEPQKAAPDEKLPGGARLEAPQDFRDPEVAALPVLAQVGIVAPAAAGKTWLLTQLGRGWLIANVVASGWFFLMGSILQQHWAPLRDGEVNERAVAAVVGAGVMLLTVVNAVICGLKLMHEVHGQ